MVQQLSVFIENSRGKLAGVTQALAQAGIDILAVSIADTADFGILRAIVGNPEGALAHLRAAGFSATSTPVIAVEVNDAPGGMAHVLGLLSGADISVEYLYSFVRRAGERALIILRVDDIPGALGVLNANRIKTMGQEDILAL